MTEKPESITHFRLDPAQPLTLTPEQQAQLDARPIDYSDIPELPDDFWTRHPPVARENKRLITLRLDADVLAFFQKHGRRYQTQINAVLRAYMEAQSREQEVRPTSMTTKASVTKVRKGAQNISRDNASGSFTLHPPEERSRHGSDTR
jgi:uncharacterized protein (DUF4415 family)